MEEDFLKCDLHRKLGGWDATLPIADFPSYQTLIDYLCRRILSSQCWVFIAKVVRFLLQFLLYLLGFEDAHNKIQRDHHKDAVKNCWYCPSHEDDRFGLRPGQTMLDASSLPNQVQTSYAMVIRGLDSSTSILDSLAININDDNCDQFVLQVQISYAMVIRGLDSSTSILDGLAVNINNNNEQPVFECNGSPMVHRASLLILSILKAREFYCQDHFKPDMYKNKSMTMQWYSFLFGTSLQYHRELIERHTTARDNSRHIVVIYQENMYKVQLIRKDVMGQEVMPTYEEIKRQIEKVIKTSTSSSALCVNSLTTLPANERYFLEQTLREASDRNRYNFGILRDCLLVVSLDSEDSPRMANESLYLLQSKNFQNRWYDKSLNVVIFKNGVAGFVLNYLCGMTGTVVSSFIELIKDIESDLLHSLYGQIASKHDQIKLKELSTPSLLAWDDNEDKTISKEINRIKSMKNTSCPFTGFHPAMFKLKCNTTKHQLICSGVSPSGTFHAALQLALMQMCHRSTDVYEIVSIRHFRFGGLVWMETSTAEMRLFVEKATEYLKNPRLESRKRLKTLFHNAVSLYRKDTVRHKEGVVNLWHLDAIYRVLGLQTRLPSKPSRKYNLRSIIQQPLIDYLRTNGGLLPPRVAETFTSNPGWNPAVEAVGRVGVKSMLPLGVHYLFSTESIAITVSSSDNHPCHGKHEDFAKEISKSFGFIDGLLTEEIN